MSIETKPVDFETEMRNAFKVFDKDGSGTISADEIFQVMKSFGENLSEADIKMMVKEVDKDGNGTIDCKFIDSPTHLKMLTALAR